MLTQETKRKIDNARQILVGKIPDPKAQVEQITTALIYKFMDDMDRESEDLGGKARFFANGFEKYAWGKLMDPKLSAHQRLDLYIEAITKMSRNPHLPQLFRDIFKDAFLPFRSPETLNLFLKEISSFNYSNSEDLGDAFEYLLSIMGSQGDAGQFRTPRHIIDFIVEVIDPQKNETILDPACGTAGFLISAYKHIRRENKNKLTPDERKKLMNNLVGYDISPDMVKLSLVNMYLHDFPEPKIYEYDTLSSEDRWDETFDVIMANPPFMTPKGGIRPHKRFSVRANRSEVLFVDYILEHLNQKGRAGIIVPEGIIFQTANAYKELRRLLIEDGLFAVVSLPAGVFNPYSGVKTSILFFDNALAKKAKGILFIKIENDGYDLGAQRRKLEEGSSELPIALHYIHLWQETLRTGGRKVKIKGKKEWEHAIWVDKEKIKESGDYNLSGDRYKEVEEYKKQKWPMVEIGEIAEFKNGLWKGKKEPFVTVKIIRNTNFTKDGTINLSDVAEHPVEKRHLEDRRLQSGDIILENSGGGPTQPVGRVVYFDINNQDIYSFSNFTSRIRVKDRKVNSKYLFYMLLNLYKKGETERLQKRTSGIRNLDKKAYQKIKIPLPPLEVQKEIVGRIEKKQEIINNAKELIAKIERERANSGRIFERLDCEWVELKEVIESVKYPPKIKKSKFLKSGKYPIIDQSENFIAGYWNEGGNLFKIDKPIIVFGDHTRIFKYIDFDFVLGADGVKILKPVDKLLPKYFYYYLTTAKIKNLGYSRHYKELIKIKVPISPKEVQKEIIEYFDKQQQSIQADQQLIKVFEQQIKDEISEVWGE